MLQYLIAECCVQKGKGENISLLFYLTMLKKKKKMFKVCCDQVMEQALLLRMKIIHTDHFHRDPKKRKRENSCKVLKGTRQHKSHVCPGHSAAPTLTPLSLFAKQAQLLVSWVHITASSQDCWPFSLCFVPPLLNLSIFLLLMSQNAVLTFSNLYSIKCQKERK